MSAARLAAFFIALSAVVYTGTAFAQQHPDDQDTVRRRMFEVYEQESADARDFARRHGIPIRMKTPGGRVYQIFGVDGGRPIVVTSHNAQSAQVTHTTALYPGGLLNLNLTGAGELLGIWDEDHVLGDHIELSGRVTYGDTGDAGDHATHVAGTMAASGVLPDARGMAFAADLRSYEWTSDEVEMANEADDGLLISNHSYGLIAGWHFGDVEGQGEQWYWFGDPNESLAEDAAFGSYDSRASQYDRAAYTNPYYLPVVAAGNDRADRGPRAGSYRGYNSTYDWTTYDVSGRPIPADGGTSGYDTIAGSALAKDVLTVGSIGVTASGALYTSGFTSYGPADDGRIKPDVVGVGENVLSPIATGNNSYGRASGTSMAAPNVSGTLILLQQYFRQLYGHPMRAATLKGLAVHTAHDLEAPGPDYKTGWGLLDAEAAVEAIDASLDDEVAMFEETLAMGATFTQAVDHQGDGPIRVTLCWSDPPSTRHTRNGASTVDDPFIHLVHDLDVRLVDDASGTTFTPYVLDPSHPGDAATTGDNVVDPIEQIYLPNAPAGEYTVVVSHKGSFRSTDTQAFSLITTGLAGRPRAVFIDRATADAAIGVVRLEWRTLFERQQGSFVVERAELTSQPGLNDVHATFQQIRTVTGDGTAGHTYALEDRGLASGAYTYRISYDLAGGRTVLAQLDAFVPAPDRFSILSNYPNPFRERSTLVVDVPKDQDVRVDAFDALGRRVATLYRGHLRAGRHELPIDASGWPAGIYFARVAAASATSTRRLVVVR